jgi:hypothetical protein
MGNSTRPLRKLGSGKFGTPCERTQEAYARSPVACVPPPAEGPAVLVVVVETVATPGVGAPPPQPATSRATPEEPGRFSGAWHIHTVRSASVGESRAARSAGSRPATAPIRSAAPSPPAQARVGMTIAQPLVEA